jgi:hypothetical protein
MFLAGWWVARREPVHFAVKSALTVWLTYALIDLPIVLASGVTLRGSVVVSISLITKAAAAYFGAGYAKRSRVA